MEASKSAVSSAARRVWEHVYLLRKNELEEATRTALSTGGNVGLGHDIETFRNVVTEPAMKVWKSYIEDEKRRTSLLFGSHASQNTPTSAGAFVSVAQTISGTGTAAGAVIHRGLTRMSSKVAGFTTNLLSRSRNSESSTPTPVMLGLLTCPAITSVTVSAADVAAWTQYHLSIVSELVNWRWMSSSEDNRIEDKRLLESWYEIERCLLSFPGLWGPVRENPLLKHQLSMAEGPMRMRKLMLPNHSFYENYPVKNRPVAVVNSDDVPQVRKGGKLRLPYSQDSDIWEKESSYRLNTLFESLDSSQKICFDKSQVQKVEPLLAAEDGGDTEEITSDQQGQQSSDDQSQANVDERMAGVASSKLLRGFLEDGDQVQHIYRCARVQGLDSVEGLLLFGIEHLYILDGFTLLKSKEIVEISRLPADLHRPIVPTTCYASGSAVASTAQLQQQQVKHNHAKLRYSTIREVLKRRYLLQPIAIEVYSNDGQTVLLAFPHAQTRKAVLSRLVSSAPGLLDNAEQSVAGQKAGAHVESSSNLFSNLIADRSVTDRWVGNEISNFQYLMHLNTLAQRSYQDLMQYPVFPWILADYESEKLDLADPETFRDLSKPMGAQTPERVQQFQKRYSEWDDSTGEAGPYHCKFFIELCTNECFKILNFFKDGTHYSSAMIVASYLVRLEPFTQIFLRLQGGCFDLPDRMFHSVREQWVSASRNNMTDVKELIPEFFYLPEFLSNTNRFDFGAKQNGTMLDDVVLPTWANGSGREFIRIHREALESDYVSAHLNEWIDLIFGYRQYGPDAVKSVNVFHPYFYKGAVDIDSITDPVKRNATIGFINNFGQMPKQLFKRPHPTKKLGIEGLLSSSRLVFNNVSVLQPAKAPVKELKAAVGQLVINERGQVLAVEQNKSLIPPNFSHCISWGFADMSVRLSIYDSEKTVAVYESLDSQMVLCSLCPSPGLLVTAGKSSTINVWRIDTARTNTPARLHAQLVGHSDAITCLNSSAAFRILLSGSRDGVAMQWDLNQLCFIRELCRLQAPISAIATNELTGDIAVCATTELQLFTINGQPLCSINACPQENQQVLCVAFSQMNEWDDRNIILTGGSDGVVRIWSLQHSQVPAESPTASQSRLPIGEVGKEQQKAVATPVIDDNEPLLLEACSEDKVEGESFDIDTDSANIEQESSSCQDQKVSGASSPTSSTDMNRQGSFNRAGSLQQIPMTWRYQLVFRGKLTSHTSFDRNDNRMPAAVTAMVLSRDHRTVFVGDARGRILR